QTPIKFLCKINRKLPIATFFCHAATPLTLLRYSVSSLYYLESVEETSSIPGIPRFLVQDYRPFHSWKMYHSPPRKPVSHQQQTLPSFYRLKHSPAPLSHFCLIHPYDHLTKFVSLLPLL